MGIKSLSNSSGIVNFQKHQSMLAGIELNKFHHLETVRLGSSAASVEFTNLGQYSDFQHLQLRAVFRTNRSGYTATYWNMQFNGDTGANYFWRWLTAGYNGSAVESGGYINQSFIRASWAPGATASANLFACSVTDIFDAFNPTKNTNIKTLFGKTESQAMVGLGSGAWNNTSPVSSIKIYDALSAEFIAGSRFSLYGLKARA